MDKLDKTNVLDLEAQREKVKEERRLGLQRLILGRESRWPNVALEDGGKLRPIEVLNISQGGFAFQVNQSLSESPIDEGSEVKIRFYFTETTYIPVNCFVTRFTPCEDSEGRSFVEYGCEFNKSLKSYEGIKSFVDLLYSLKNHGVNDKGEAAGFWPWAKAGT